MKSCLSTFFVSLLISLPLAATADITHLNVDHREMVHLRWLATNGLCGSGNISGQFRQLLQTAKLANQEFAVPAGKELVITDVNWTATQSAGNLWSDDYKLSATISIRTEANEFGGVLARRLGMVKTEAGKQTVEGTEVNLTGGYRVASRRSLCGQAFEFAGGLTSPAARLATLDSMEIFGYLVDKTI